MIREKHKANILGFHEYFFHAFLHFPNQKKIIKKQQYF